MIELGVNIDHGHAAPAASRFIRTVAAALRAEDAGADLITLHLREDRRHIQDKDVYALRPAAHAHEPGVRDHGRNAGDRPCRQAQRRLPGARKRTELTTEGGLEVAGALAAVTDAVGLLAESGIRVSLFIDPEPAQIAAAAQAGAPWSSCTPAPMPKRRTRPRPAELTRIRVAVAEGLRHGLRVNAGHGLHYGNVGPVAAVDGIAELNIGHAIVAQAVFDGWEKAVRDMKALMVQARAARPRSVAARPARRPVPEPAAALMPMSDAASDPAAATPPVPSAPKAGAIAGIGMDLLRIDRIERALARHGDRFAEKILGVEELRKFHARRARDPVRRALPGHALRRQGSLFQGHRPGHAHAHDLASGADPERAGRAAGARHRAGAATMDAARFGAAHVSITDETDMAAAYVVVESKPLTAAPVSSGPPDATKRTAR